MPIFLCLKKTHSGLCIMQKRTPRRWVDLHVHNLRGVCLTLQLIPGGSLPSVAHFRFGCGSEGTANICTFQIYRVKKIETHKYSCGILRRFGFIYVPLQAKQRRYVYKTHTSTFNPFQGLKVRVQGGIPLNPQGCAVYFAM